MKRFLASSVVCLSRTMKDKFEATLSLSLTQTGGEPRYALPDCRDFAL
jgi:hypothetical protein